MRKFEKIGRGIVIAGGALALSAASSSGCSKATTSPTTPTSAAAVVTETFTGTLTVGGSRFYSYATPADGTATATLVTIGGSGVPESVVVNLGFGVPNAFGCTAGATAVQVVGTAGVSASITESQTAGVHCVQVADFGNLYAPAQFTVTIDHP
jgi:hypothetical protein